MPMYLFSHNKPADHNEVHVHLFSQDVIVDLVHVYLLSQDESAEFIAYLSTHWLLEHLEQEAPLVVMYTPVLQFLGRAEIIQHKVSGL